MHGPVDPWLLGPGCEGARRARAACARCARARVHARAGRPLFQDEGSAGLKIARGRKGAKGSSPPEQSTRVPPKGGTPMERSGALRRAASAASAARSRRRRRGRKPDTRMEEFIRLVRITSKLRRIAYDVLMRQGNLN